MNAAHDANANGEHKILFSKNITKPKLLNGSVFIR